MMADFSVAVSPHSDDEDSNHVTSKAVRVVWSHRSHLYLLDSSVATVPLLVQCCVERQPDMSVYHLMMDTVVSENAVDVFV